MQIFVTNKNDFYHEDAFNGQKFAFEPGSKQLIDAEAASHMFGFGRKDKTENLLRLGWSNLPDDEGVRWLAKFVFTDARVVEVESEDEQEEVKQEQVEQKA